MLPLAAKVAKLEHPIVMAFGNPLLDVFTVTRNNQLLVKFKLKIDGHMELDRNEMDQLFDDLGCCCDNDDHADAAGNDKLLLLKKTICAGGCALNTVRILQQLLCSGGGGGANDRPDGPRMCVYYGSLGNDARAVNLRKLVENAHIDARFAVHASLPTGICVSIINDPQRTCRSLAANLGAASVYSLSDLNNTDLPLDSVRIIYIEGFFIVHSFDVAKQVVKRAQGKNIIIAFNLCGTYIFEQHCNEICEMVGLADVIFGNVQEMIALAKALNLQYNDQPEYIPFILNNLKRVTVNAAAASSSSSNAQRSNDWRPVSNNIIVMTQGGSNPATVVWGQGNHASCNPMQATRPIQDTTGAGDALVSGFFAGLITGQDPATCLRWGCKVAAQVITNIGATLLAADTENLCNDFLLYFADSESTT